MESKKNKEDWLTIRVGTDLKNRIKEMVDLGRYPDMSTFVIEAIQEKLDPSRKVDVKEQIRQALSEDPSLLDDSLRRIGIRFFVQKSDDQQ
jgi:Arc/MetJ-type ribon-helix-helix transcriptional regulator